MEKYDIIPNVKDIQAANPVTLLSMNNLPQDLKYELFIAAELYTLRVAYPVQARKFTEREVRRTNELWAEIFTGVDLELLHKAIIRFIATDHKAFFPSPGQIIRVLKDIMAEEEAERKRITAEKHWAKVAEIERRKARGENCSTCRFCEHRQVGVGSNGLGGPGSFSSLKNLSNPGNSNGRGSFNHRSNFNQYTPRNNRTKLFCQNPESYKFEGQYGHGTAATILCEYYAPIAQPEGKQL